MIFTTDINSFDYENNVYFYEYKYVWPKSVICYGIWNNWVGLRINAFSLKRSKLPFVTNYCEKML